MVSSYENNGTARGTGLWSDTLAVEVYKLENGLTVWLNEDHSQPKIFGAVVVKAGAKDTPNTGIAHYFEHMMFKGTDKIGTTNYSAEKAILDVIFAKYDALAQTEDPEERTHLLKIINDLSVRAAEYVIPNEFDQMISSFGGTEMEAVTSYDYTFYFNTFAPQYLVQWAEINSERLLNPVFRMFQSEMETVREERMRYNDTVSHMAIEWLNHRFFYPHPYAYPIIGSLEYLSNPSVTEMRKFFERYYVASNMGLILSGDLDRESAMPVIEAAFSRLRKGRVPKSPKVDLPDFKGKEKVTVRVPLPFLRIMALGFRGASNRSSDVMALEVASNLLNNSNGTGLLDHLILDHKVKGALVMNKNLNEAGILGIVALPKNWLQSYAAVEKLIWKQIDRVKTGDFSDELFQSVKLELKREWESLLENINSRAEQMMHVFSKGKNWSDYLEEIDRIDALTKEDIMAVAQKYFSDQNYLRACKRTGRYPSQVAADPALSPIVPKNRDRASDYRRHLEELPVKEKAVRLLDFEKDVRIMPLSDRVTLYTSPNPVNEIFSLAISYGVGELECQQLSALATYLPYLGTDEMTFEVFRGKLQALGGTISISSTDLEFTILVHGFERYFVETLTLVKAFLSHLKPDDKKMQLLLDEERIAVHSWASSSETLGQMLFEKIKFGEQSRFLTKLTSRELRKLKGADLLDTLKKVTTVACDIHYCGRNTTDFVAEQVRKMIPIDRVTLPSHSPFVRDLRRYESPTVFFVEKNDINQAILYCYSNIGPLADLRARSIARVFTDYFGNGASSLLFQEIREFRSFAYQVDGGVVVPTYNEREKAAYFYMRLSTQADKAVEAARVFEGLVKEMPLDENRLNLVKKQIRNQLSNDYPTYRTISIRVAGMRREGFTEDPNRRLLQELDRVTIQDIRDFHTAYIRDAIRVYALVANQKAVDLRQLEALGAVERWISRELYH